MVGSRRGSLMSVPSAPFYSPPTQPLPATDFVTLPTKTPYIVVAYGRDLSQNNFFLAHGLAPVDKRRNVKLQEGSSHGPFTHTHINGLDPIGRTDIQQIPTPRTSADFAPPPTFQPSRILTNIKLSKPFWGSGRVDDETHINGRPITECRSCDSPNTRAAPLPPIYPTSQTVSAPAACVSPSDSSSHTRLSDSSNSTSEPKATSEPPPPPVARSHGVSRLPDRHSSLPNNIIHGSQLVQAQNPQALSIPTRSNTPDWMFTNAQPRLHKNASLPISMVSSYANYCVPWSDTPISVHVRGGLARIALPLYTEAIGFAAGEHCFPRDSVEILELSGPCDVHLPDGNVYSGVHGLIYPCDYPKYGNVICRLLGCDTHPKPRSHLASAGISLLDSCLDKNSLPNIVPKSTMFVLRSNQHYIEKVVHNRHILCDPYHLPRLPQELVCTSIGRQCCYVVVESRFVPIAVVLFCLTVMSIPGFVQAFGSADKQWGDIINQIIGTGSVFLMAVLCYFERLFGTQLVSRRSLEGSFNVTSDAAAKLFAPEKVEEISKFACDPRICSKLVKHGKNSAVRAKREGWLKIGEGIPCNEMENHGYVVLSARGVVLDLLEAHIYTCAKKKEGARRIHINRGPIKHNHEICKSFVGDEVFA